MFYVLIGTVLAATHIFVGASFSYLLGLSAVGRGALAAFLSFMFVISFFGFPLLRLLPAWILPSFSFVFYMWLGLLLLLSVAFAVADIATIFLSLLPETLAFDPSRRDSLKQFLGLAALGSTGLLSGVAYKNAIQMPLVQRQEISIQNLPSSFEGFKIAQLSDLHIGSAQDGAWLKNIVAETNALEPDLIVITGDLVDGPVGELKDEVASLSELRAPHGVYFVTGNHDYYSGADAWCAYVETLGVRPLRNACASIVKEKGAINLVGIEDYSASRFGHHRADLLKALESHIPENPIVLLAHQPLHIFEAVRHGIDLQLSGHTHGGQIWPFGFLVRLQQPYLKGLHRHEDSKTQICVSTGSGCWGPPMRLGAQEEINFLTLQREQENFEATPA